MSSDPIALALLSLVLKAPAYYLVIAWGLKHFQVADQHSFRRVATLVVVRMALGVMLAIPLWLATSTAVVSLPHSATSIYLVYFLIYGSVRWLLWSIIALRVVPGARTTSAFILGGGSTDRKWRMTAVAVSFASDLPVIIGFGSPIVGRFFC